MSEEVSTPGSALTVVPAGGQLVVSGDKVYRLMPMAESQPAARQEEAGLSVRDILLLLNKHKWLLVTMVLVTCLMGAVRTLLSTPTYRSTVVLQFEKSPNRVVPFSEISTEDQVYIDDTMFLQTQYGLLKSRGLAQRVVSELGLYTKAGAAPRPGVRPGQPAPTGNLLERLWASYKQFSEPRVRSPEQLSEMAAVGALQGSLSVEPVRNSRLVYLHAVHTDPEMAARIANATADAFIAMAIERRLESSSYAKTYLQDQIQATKAKLEESERRLNLYTRQKQILSLDEKTDVVNQTYTDYASALVKAEQERIKAEALFQEVRNNPNKIPATLDSKMVQVYKEQQAKLENEYQQGLAIYKPEFPKMVQLKLQIADVEKKLREEIRAYGTAIQAQYEAALKHEALLRDKLASTRDNVLSTQETSIDLNLLKREVDTNRQLYDSLLQRVKQLGVSSGVTMNNATIVDRAEPDVLPFQPSFRNNLLIAAFVGLLIGAGLALLIELWDETIKAAKDVEALGLPLLGLIPKVDKAGRIGGVAMACHNDPQSMVAEAYRSTRTSVDFSTVDGAPRRLMVTSTMRDEGKSTSALALAINFAQLGHRTVLVDADLRNPSVHKLLGLHNEFGLSNLLVGEHQEHHLCRRTEVPNLSVITAGALPPNPVELLSGPRLLRLLDTLASLGFDRIIIDAPPMLGLADAVVLGKHIKNLLFVIQSNRTKRSNVKDALRRLGVAGLTPRGALITQAARDAMPGKYEMYYGYGAVHPERLIAADPAPN
jgi:polysaccharide biosynthesis transport protein